MTINSSANKTIVSGNGAQTQFAFSFVGVAAAYIAVILTDASGNETVLARGSGATQYQISLNAPVQGALWGLGGTVTYDPSGTPIPNGSSLTIFRTLPLTQAISLQNQISLNGLGDGAETGLDTLEMQIQQVSELFQRAIVAPIVDPTAPLPLPPIAQRANMGMAFDGNGNPIAAALPASGVISSAMQPVVDAATLALGRTAFGLGAMATEGIGAGLQDDGSGNARVNTAISEVATNQAIHASNHLNVYAASGALTFTLDRANTLFDGFTFTVYALTGAITLVPNAADNFFSLASGAALIIPKGAVATISTDAAASGLWYIEVSGVSPIIKTTVFTSGGTYTPSLGLLYAVVEAVGGAGAGGGVSTFADVTSGGGGGGGAYARAALSAAQIGTGQVVTIGAGGGGTTGGGGSNGTASSLGTLCIADFGRGGGGGSNSNGGSGGAGGTTGTGDIVIPGGDGNAGFFASITTAAGVSGRGGESLIGAGGRSLSSSSSTTAAGAAGKNYGGGGGGAFGLNGGNAAGGNGAPGVVIITEYLAFAA